MSEFKFYDRIFEKYNPKHVKKSIIQKKRMQEENKIYIILAFAVTGFFIIIIILYIVYKNKKNKQSTNNTATSSDAFILNNLKNNNNLNLTSASNIDFIIRTVVNDNKTKSFQPSSDKIITTPLPPSQITKFSTEELSSSSTIHSSFSLEENLKILKNKIIVMLSQEYTNLSKEKIVEIAELYIKEQYYLPDQWKNLKEMEININGSNSSNSSNDNEAMYLLERRLNYIDEEDDDNY